MKKKILLVTKIPRWAVGGIQRHEDLMTLALHKNFNVSRHEVGNYQNKRINSFSLLLFLETAQALRRFNYDILIVTDPQVAAICLAAILFSKTNKKFIFSHGWCFHDEKNLLIKKIYFMVFAKNLLKSFKVISVSPNDQQYFPKSTLMKNCASLFAGESIEIEKKNQVIYFGRMSEAKNISLMLQLAHEISSDYNLTDSNREDLRFIFCGPDAESFSEANSEFVEIIHSPSDSELSLLISKSKYFFSLSRYEGFGISAVEALSFGCIPILSDIKPFREHIEKLNCGKLVSLFAKPDYMRYDILEFLRSVDSYTDEKKLKIRKQISEYAEQFSPDLWMDELSKIMSK